MLYALNWMNNYCILYIKFINKKEKKNGKEN